MANSVSSTTQANGNYQREKGFFKGLPFCSLLLLIIITFKYFHISQSFQGRQGYWDVKQRTVTKQEDTSVLKSLFPDLVQLLPHGREQNTIISQFLDLVWLK